MRRYLFNTLSGFATLYLFFLFIFYGAQYIGGEQLSYGDTLEGIIVGFTVWTLTIMAFSELSWALTREAQYGTLEQLYMSPLGFGWVVTCQVLAAAVISIVWVGVQLLAMMVTTGRYLNVDLVSVLPLALFIIIGVYGVGLMMGGLQLVFKRVEGAFQIMQFVFLGLVVAPVDSIPLLRVLPVSMGSHLMNQVMVHGASIFDIPAWDLGALILGSLGFLLAGYAVFKSCERVCLERGLLGHY